MQYSDIGHLFVKCHIWDGLKEAEILQIEAKNRNKRAELDERESKLRELEIRF